MTFSFVLHVDEHPLDHEFGNRPIRGGIAALAAGV